MEALARFSHEKRAKAQISSKSALQVIYNQQKELLKLICSAYLM
jgi:hypothetical protein